MLANSLIVHHCARRRHRVRPSIVALVLALGIPSKALAQGAVGDATTPIFQFVVASALSYLVPAGIILISVATLDVRGAWRTALSGLSALGIAGIAYWAFGFALQFGGVGLATPHPGLRRLVWEWSLLGGAWGNSWGMAGLSGWFLNGDVSATAYALFLAHLPWAMTAAALVVMALRGRAATFITFIMAAIMAGFVYPIAGNWVQGGGWLSALGRNLGQGHGFIDFAGAGTVFLVCGSFGLATLTLWRRRPAAVHAAEDATSLPHAPLPLLAAAGGLLLLCGATGWLWSNPLQVATLQETALLRGSVSLILGATAGGVFPAVYTWFVSGESHPALSVRGLLAGLVAVLAAGPFIPPFAAMLVGLLAGASVPFVTYTLDTRFHAADHTALISTNLVPALIGLLWIGFMADGVAGAGWQTAAPGGAEGATGQGVSGLLVAAGFSANFPGQLQAQFVGVLALFLWGLITGLLVGLPLRLFQFGLDRSRAKSAPPLTYQTAAMDESATLSAELSSPRSSAFSTSLPDSGGGPGVPPAELQAPSPVQEEAPPRRRVNRPFG